jgi:hypothetical protein
VKERNAKEENKKRWGTVKEQNERLELKRKKK